MHQEKVQGKCDSRIEFATAQGELVSTPSTSLRYQPLSPLTSQRRTFVICKAMTGSRQNRGRAMATGCAAIRYLFLCLREADVC